MQLRRSRQQPSAFMAIAQSSINKPPTKKGIRLLIPIGTLDPDSIPVPI